MKRRCPVWMVLCMCAALSGCAGKETDERETEVLLEPVGLASNTVRVQRKDMVDADYETGYVVPTSYSLSFEIDGTVSYCEIHPGDQVEKYQELAALDEQELEEELQELDIRYENLLGQYTLLNQQWDQETERMQEELEALSPDTKEAELLRLSLDERAYAHEEELEAQEQALSVLAAQYDEKNHAMTKNRLLSPCDGVVMSVEIRPGQEVTAQSCVIIIGDYSAAYISCDTFYYDTHIEGLVSMTGYLGDRSFPVGYISYTPEEIRNATVNGTVGLPSRFSLDMEQTGAQIGDFAAVQLVNEVVSDALCVSKDAVYSDAGGSYVYKNVNGTRQRIDVRTGIDNGAEVEILEGDLREGDEVYVQK